MKNFYERSILVLFGIWEILVKLFACIELLLRWTIRQLFFFILWPICLVIDIKNKSNTRKRLRKETEKSINSMMASISTVRVAQHLGVILFILGMMGAILIGGDKVETSKSTNDNSSSSISETTDSSLSSDTDSSSDDDTSLSSDTDSSSNDDTSLSSDTDSGTDEFSTLTDAEIDMIVYTCCHEVGEDNYDYFPNGDYEEVYRFMAKLIKNRANRPDLFQAESIAEVLLKPGQFDGVIYEMQTDPRFDVTNNHMRVLVADALNDSSIPDDLYWEHSFAPRPTEEQVNNWINEETLTGNTPIQLERYRTVVYEESAGLEPTVAPYSDNFDRCIAFHKAKISGSNGYLIYATRTKENRLLIYMGNPEGFL